MPFLIALWAILQNNLRLSQKKEKLSDRGLPKGDKGNPYKSDGTPKIYGIDYE